ncbi:MAG: helix-turn-helix domain-containing protein [Aeromonas sp.]
MNISEIEQRQLQQLHTIISPELARERDVRRKETRRREAGAMSRAEYEQARKAQASSKAERAKALREQGLSAVKIAETMGIGLRTVKLYLPNHN